MTTSPIDRLAEGLARPEAYRGLQDALGPVEWVQTHLSHVFLAGRRVFKLRKSVALGFVDFSLRAARNRDCERELAVNRRLSPDVYLGLAPVLPGSGGVRVGDVGPRVEDPEAEHVVVMRRLAEGRDALSLLERGALTSAHLNAVADRMAAFHRHHGLGTPAPWPPEAWQERVAAPIRDNLDILEEVLGPDALKGLRDATEAALAAAAPALERRRREGRAVDGHGDLHLQHVWFEAGPDAPRVIDGLEFSEELRHIDAASEVAFLAMDLRYRDHGALAEGFLARYAERADDYGLYDVVDLFMSYRAAVRGKVAAIAAGDAGLPEAQRAAARESALRHAALAQRLLAPRPPAPLLVMCGTVGSGKSSVAREIARAVGGVVVATDRVRKVGGGSGPVAAGQRGVSGPAAADRGRYAPAKRHAVYRAVLRRARAPLDAGRPTLLDATFASRREREAARALADATGSPALLIEVRVGRAVARRRLARRRRLGRSLSDAGPEFLDHSIRSFEPPFEWPRRARFALRTDRPAWRRGALDVARHVLSLMENRKRQGDRDVEVD